MVRYRGILPRRDDRGGEGDGCRLETEVTSKDLLRDIGELFGALTLAGRHGVPSRIGDRTIRRSAAETEPAPPLWRCCSTRWLRESAN
jgi:hypothetical protein